MAEAYHIIERHVFDIRYPYREKAYELQTRFSRLFDGDGKAVLQEVADRVIPDNLLLRLEELNVDLGDIPHDRLEKDFPKRLKEALEKELRRVLQEHGRGDASGGTRALGDLLEHFLLTGSLPWWVAGDVLTDPVAVVERLIAHDAAGLKRILLSTGQREYVRRRLIRQFPEKAVRAMVTTLEPDEAPFIFVYYADVAEIEKRETIFRQESKEFQQSLWMFILTYLLVDRGSHFNRKIFVRSTLTQMAHQYNRDYSELIRLMFRALEDEPLALIRRSALSGIIQALYEEESGRLEVAVTQGPADRMAARLEMIRSFLVDGVLDAKVSAAIVMELVAEAPVAISELLRSVSEREEVWAKIVGTWDEQVVKALVRLREPEESEFIFHYARRLAILQRQQLIVKTDGSGFFRSVWELILAFVWTEQGSLFNTRRFLEYHIRRLARRYQLSYRDLLGFLVQGIGQEIRSDRDSSLFHSLTVLLEESQPEAPGDKLGPVKDAGSASAAEWLAALDHFLIYRQWPKHWRLEGGITEAMLLQQVLQWLFRESAMQLMKLLLEIRRRVHPPVDDAALKMVREGIVKLFGSTALARQRVEDIRRVSGEEPLRLLVLFMGDEVLPAIAELRRHEQRERTRSDRGKDSEATRSEKPAGQSDSLYIQNAGLILLHPLLPHFFGQLGMTKERRWVDEAMQERAVHLLQFLVDGLEHPEHRLILNKLLCGIPVQEPIGREFAIRDDEAELAEELWSVLRERWPKMQHTSKEGFQVSFLQRGGALTAVEDGWRLRVEQKGIDVLLSFLPWSWGMVRLPWMNATIYTEWT